MPKFHNSNDNCRRATQSIEDGYHLRHAGHFYFESQQ